MALALDGYVVLRRIGQHADVFAGVKSEASKAAQTLVLKQLKVKTAGIESLRAVYRALEADTFALIVDGLADAQAKSLVTKFDKHNKEVKSASALTRRRHLTALADGSVDPARKPERVKKPAAKSKRAAKSAPRELDRLSSEAMGARRRRD